jgi:hypothetical protein
MTPQDHNKTLGITHLAYGGFHLLMMTLFTLFFFFIMALPHRGVEEPGMFAVFMLVIMAFSLLFTLPSIVAGIALLKHKSWARTAAIVAGILACPSFPYGTVLGVYTLWFMFGNEGKNFYAGTQARWSPPQVGALPAAPTGGTWAANPPNSREREPQYAPPPKMPDWR